MGKKKSLILLSTADWDEPNWTNKQHIAMEFHKKSYRVLYVEPPIYLGRYFLNTVKKVKSQNWLKKLFFYRRVKTDLHIISQFYLFPARLWKINYYLGSFLNIIFIKYVLMVLGFRFPYIINYLPYGDLYIGKFGELASVYDCVDEYSAMRNTIPEISYLEEKLMRKVNAVSVTARGLLPIKSKYNKKTEFIQNVGNCSLFLFDEIKNRKAPKDLGYSPEKKIVGFIGAVNFKIDVELLEKLLLRFPDIYFVFIGPVYGFPLKRFQRYTNINFLGPRDLKTIPDYVKHFNAGIIPYYINEYTKYVFPLKLFEYFAAKIPVVSTEIPELIHYKESIFISSDIEGFINNLNRVLQKEFHEKMLDNAYDIACKYDWRYRADKIEVLLKK